ncbi:MarR family winged helix-turn-helix transcriptional regulator [Streptomyces sp. NPDC093093]|uniref:MarR family winged helix-turn-helix transcriptional regulator n=1 Tax=Streptomyces sp. NPDC093093 TaxID=3366025 RepID=UPI00381C40E1
MEAQEQDGPVQPDGAPAPPADRMVCYTVNQAARLLTQAVTHRLAALGAAPGQLPALLALYENDGQTQAELARHTGVEQPTMALNLKRMERDGLITRSPDPTDARRALVHLTKTATAIRADIQALRTGIDTQALDGFTRAEQTQLGSLLDRLVTNLQTLAAPPTSTT